MKTISKKLEANISYSGRDRGQPDIESGRKHPAMQRHSCIAIPTTLVALAARIFVTMVVVAIMAMVLGGDTTCGGGVPGVGKAGGGGGSGLMRCVAVNFVAMGVWGANTGKVMPQRSATITVTKIVKIENRQSASTYGWLSYYALAEARYGESSASRPGAIRWTNAVEIYAQREEKISLLADNEKWRETRRERMMTPKACYSEDGGRMVLTRTKAFEHPGVKRSGAREYTPAVEPASITNIVAIRGSLPPLLFPVCTVGVHVSKK
ncbi:hypothetical protein C8J57DRAFT_1222256 [Mycena rebaudengoi]|nr:hypothetical protein C8J57DRAFT_1222256 [Mycena rebaudengoi]